jgi:hypothetical protein
MTNLQEHLATLQPGDVPDPSGLDRLLADCWADFKGSGKGGMAGYKLPGRMEKVRWQPPILSFVVERHGVKVMGSTRGELQHWEIDLDARTADIVKTSHRQLEKTAPRISLKDLAEEIAERILSGEEDDRIKCLEDGSVKVLVSKIFPAGSGFQRTVSGRRKRLVQYVAAKLAQKGWAESETSSISERCHPSFS